MVRAKIKTKQGTEIEIEGDTNTIKEVISFLQKREDQEARFNEHMKLRRNEVMHGKQPSNLSEAIVKLKAEGFFKNKRSMSDIKDELSNKGFHYPSTTLSPVLLYLTRKGELGRLKEDKQWRYVQR